MMKNGFWKLISNRFESLSCTERRMFREYERHIERASSTPHRHEKPLLTEGWVKVLEILAAVAAGAVAMMAGYYATHHDDSEALPYKPEIEDIPIR